MQPFTTLQGPSALCSLKGKTHFGMCYDRPLRTSMWLKRTRACARFSAWEHRHTPCQREGARVVRTLQVLLLSTSYSALKRSHCSDLNAIALKVIMAATDADPNWMRVSASLHNTFNLSIFLLLLIPVYFKKSQKFGWCLLTGAHCWQKVPQTGE